MIPRTLCIGICVTFTVGLVLVGLFGKRAYRSLRARLSRPLPISMEHIPSDASYRNIIFLHHSCGALLISQGGARTLFNQKGYQFWDHDYNTIGLIRPDGSRTRTCYDIPMLNAGVRGGGNTDPAGLAHLFAQPVHTPPDNAFSRLLQHKVIIFKSCYPNSAIQSDDDLERLKSTYLQIRKTIDQHTDRIFILLTSPPLNSKATTPQEAHRARALTKWLQSDAFLKGHGNLFVFDYYDQLADPATDMLRSDYQGHPESSDSHPNAKANQAIAPLFVDFVDRAIRSYQGHS